MSTYKVTSTSRVQVLALVLVVLTSMMTTNAVGSVRLPKLVGDNMVLQRDQPLKIWGWATHGEKVSITFRGNSVSTFTSDKGEWSVTLPAQQAGGPFELRIDGQNSITLKNILVGDVWLASGQSNMEFPMANEHDFGGVINEQAEIAAANFPQIRLFTVKRSVSLRPVDEIESTGWSQTTPENIRQFSAVAYFFARELYQRYHTPIGLIHSSWGGTPAESWTSAATIRQFKDFRDVMQRETAVTPAQWSDYDRYIALKDAWYVKYKHEDRGTIDGKPVWSAVDVDDAKWLTTTMPKPWPAKLPKDFDGIIWLRKHVQLTAAQAKQGITLRLSKWVTTDTTFFNGKQVGSETGGGASRNYTVPAELLHAGDNVIAMRVEGDNNSGNGFVGSYVDPADVFVETLDTPIPLQGNWQYQPGPDLAELPAPPAVTEFRSPFPVAPTLLFNAMIAPLDAFKIKGVIWYQGEANWANPTLYRKLFPAMIKDWRAAWGYEFPFLFVQLAGFGSDPPQPVECAWAELREAQDMALSLPNTGMATAIDIGDADDIHPRNKQEVGRRLALAARKVVNHETIIASGPRYKQSQVQGKAIRVQFNDVGLGLKIKNATELHGFAIAGADGKFVWGKAAIEGNDVIVSSDAVSVPKAVRYNWGNTPQGNLYNQDDLPALPFRTDAPH